MTESRAGALAGLTECANQAVDEEPLWSPVSCSLTLSDPASAVRSLFSHLLNSVRLLLTVPMRALCQQPREDGSRGTPACSDLPTSTPADR